MTLNTFTQDLAKKTNGEFFWSRGAVWVNSGTGFRRKDPSYFVRYPSHRYESAVQWLEENGKVLFYKDQFDRLIECYQFGKYLVQDYTEGYGLLSRYPRYDYKIAVSTRKVKKLDISRKAAELLIQIRKDSFKLTVKRLGAGVVGKTVPYNTPHL